MLHFIFMNVEEGSNPQGSEIRKIIIRIYSSKWWVDDSTSCNPKTRFTSLAADLLFNWLTAIHLCLKKASSAAAVAITCNRSWEWLDNEQHGCKKEVEKTYRLKQTYSQFMWIHHTSCEFWLVTVSYTQGNHSKYGYILTHQIWQKITKNSNSSFKADWNLAQHLYDSNALQHLWQRVCTPNQLTTRKQLVSNARDRLSKNGWVHRSFLEGPMTKW